MLFKLAAVASLIGSVMSDECMMPSEEMRFCLISDTGDFLKCNDDCNRRLNTKVASFHNEVQWDEAVALGLKYGKTKLTTGAKVVRKEWRWQDRSDWDFHPDTWELDTEHTSAYLFPNDNTLRSEDGRDWVQCLCNYMDMSDPPPEPEMGYCHYKKGPANWIKECAAIMTQAECRAKRRMCFWSEEASWDGCCMKKARARDSWYDKCMESPNPTSCSTGRVGKNCEWDASMDRCMM